MKNRIINVIGQMWHRTDVPGLGRVRFDILTKVYQIFPLIGGINYSRLVEWQFVLNNLPKAPAKVMDVGSSYGLFPFKLKSLGYETHCLDQKLPNFRLPRSISFRRDNLMDLHIDSNTFDAISCISVIEHVGMGRYNDQKSSDYGDVRAVKEMLRVLKPNGRLIMTTNVCQKTCIFNNERFYGKDRLDELMSLGRVLENEYRYFDGRRWLICTEQKAFERNVDNFGIAMFVLAKV